MLVGKEYSRTKRAAVAICLAVIFTTICVRELRYQNVSMGMLPESTLTVETYNNKNDPRATSYWMGCDYDRLRPLHYWIIGAAGGDVLAIDPLLRFVCFLAMFYLLGVNGSFLLCPFLALLLSSSYGLPNTKDIMHGVFVLMAMRFRGFWFWLVLIAVGSLNKEITIFLVLLDYLRERNLTRSGVFAAVWLFITAFTHQVGADQIPMMIFTFQPRAFYAAILAVMTLPLIVGRVGFVFWAGFAYTLLFPDTYESKNYLWLYLLAVGPDDRGLDRAGTKIKEKQNG